jgi:hypothetical protein
MEAAGQKTSNAYIAQFGENIVLLDKCKFKYCALQNATLLQRKL